MINNDIKKGPPKNAVTVPTGISIGENIVLAKVSANKSIIAPPSDEDISKYLFNDPPSNLNIWGTIKPINPTPPTTDTGAPGRGRGVREGGGGRGREG